MGTPYKMKYTDGRKASPALFPFHGGVAGKSKSSPAKQGAGDVLGGAASGAAMGASVAGPWGAAIGGVVGGVSGWLKGKKDDKAEKRAREEQRRLEQEQAKLREKARIKQAFAESHKPEAESDYWEDGTPKKDISTPGWEKTETSAGQNAPQATSRDRNTPRVANRDNKEKLAQTT